MKNEFSRRKRRKGTSRNRKLVLVITIALVVLGSYLILSTRNQRVKKVTGEKEKMSPTPKASMTWTVSSSTEWEQGSFTDTYAESGSIKLGKFDGHEDGDLSEYTDPNDAWTASNDRSIGGSYYAKAVTDGRNAIWRDGWTSEQGDFLSTWAYASGGSNDNSPFLAFGYQSKPSGLPGDDGYYVMIDNVNDVFKLYRDDSGSATLLASSTPGISNQWYYVTLHWQSDGIMVATLYDSDGSTQLSQISATDTTYSSGYIGAAPENKNADEGFDNLRLRKNTGTWTSQVWDSGASLKQSFKNLTYSASVGAGENISWRVNATDTGESTGWVQDEDGVLESSEVPLVPVGYNFSVEAKLETNDTTHSPSISDFTLNLEKAYPEPEVNLTSPPEMSQVPNPINFTYEPKCFSPDGCQKAELFFNMTKNITHNWLTDTETEWNAGSFTNTTTDGSGNLVLEGSKTCYGIHQNNPGASSGVYTIDPDGAGGVAPFDVYCDMSGEGWTRLNLTDPSGDHVFVASYDPFGGNDILKCGDETKYYSLSSFNSAEYAPSATDVSKIFEVNYTTAGSVLTNAQETALRSNVVNMSTATRSVGYTCDDDGGTANDHNVFLRDASTNEWVVQDGYVDGSNYGGWWIHHIDSANNYFESPSSTFTSVDTTREVPLDVVMPPEVRLQIGSGGGTAWGYEKDYVLVRINSTGYKTSGTYTSKTFDAGKPAYWKSSSITATVPVNTDYNITYAENSSGNWTYYDTFPTNEYSQFFKYNLSLSGDGAETPSVDSVNITYDRPEETWESRKTNEASVDNGTTNWMEYDFSSFRSPTGFKWNIELTQSDGQTTFDSNRTVTVTEPPNIELNSPEDGVTGLTVNQTLNVTVTSPDGYAVDVGFFNAETGEAMDWENGSSSGSHLSFNWSGLSTGTSYKWYISTVDSRSQANVSENFTFTTTYDPTLDKISLSKGCVKEGDPLTLETVDAKDQDGDDLVLEVGNESGVYNLCNSSYSQPEIPCDFQVDWTGNSEHTLYGRIKDGKGGRSSEMARTVSSDNTKPGIPQNLGPTGVINTLNPDLNWDSGGDTGCGIDKYLARVTANEGCEGLIEFFKTSSKTHSLDLYEGTYYWQVRAVDAAGNQGNWTDCKSFTIDTSKPEEEKENENIWHRVMT